MNRKANSGYSIVAAMASLQCSDNVLSIVSIDLLFLIYLYLNTVHLPRTIVVVSSAYCTCFVCFTFRRRVHKTHSRRKLFAVCRP